MTNFLSYIFLMLVFLLLHDSFIIAQINLDSIKKEINSSSGREKINLLLELSKYHGNRDPAKGLKYAIEARDSAVALNYESGQANALKEMAYMYLRLGKYSNSQKHYKNAQKIYEKINDNDGRIATRLNIGLTHLYMDNYDSTVLFAQDALNLAKEYNDSLKIVNCSIILGTAYHYTADYIVALKYYQEGLKIALKLPPDHLLYSLYNNIGLINTEMGNYDNALQSFNQYLDYALSIGDSYHQVVALNNLGDVNEKLNRLDDAFSYYNKAKEIAEKVNDKEGLGIIYANIGLVYEKKKLYRKSLAFFYKALQIKTRLKNKVELIKTLIDIGRINRVIGKSDYAVEYLERALKIAIEFNAKNELRSIYKELSLANEDKEEFLTALNYYKNYKAVSDSIAKFNVELKITELEKEYQKDQKIQENILLKKENEHQRDIITSQKLIALILGLTLIIAVILIVAIHKYRKKVFLDKEKIHKRNKELKDLLSAKDKYISILAHDLRNPSGAVLGMTNMLIIDYEVLDEKERCDRIDYINNSVGNANKLLEGLLVWAKNQQDSIEPLIENIILSELIETTISYYSLQAKNKKIVILNRVTDQNIIIKADKFMLSTVIGNILTNAIKFSHNINEVVIDADTEGDFIEISIEDFGVGIKDEIKNKLFRMDEKPTSSATSDETENGLGLLICKEFIEKHNGKIQLESKLNEGSKFILQIPRE